MVKTNSVLVYLVVKNKVLPRKGVFVLVINSIGFVSVFDLVSFSFSDYSCVSNVSAYPFFPGYSILISNLTYTGN